MARIPLEELSEEELRKEYEAIRKMRKGASQAAAARRESKPRTQKGEGQAAKKKAERAAKKQAQEMNEIEV